MNIAIIGSGAVGTALGLGLAKAGQRVTYGVRAPQAPKHHDVLAKTNGFIASIPAAVAQAQIVVLAVPWHAVAETLAACGDLGGKVLIDVTNPLRFGADGLELDRGFDRSGAEEVAMLAKGAHIFKTLNQVGAEVMADATGYKDKPVMFVAGDNQTHKPMVLELVECLGFRAIDAGPLKVARLLEPFAMLWIHMVANHGQARDSAFAWMERNAS